MAEKNHAYNQQMELIRKAISNHSNCTELIEYMYIAPYNVVRTDLYTPQELFEEYDIHDPESMSRCLDTRVYRHVVATGKQTSVPFEMAARGFHDMGIRMAMQEFLNNYDRSKVVGIMGGHALPRTSVTYRKAVDASKRLTEQGHLMISGGGPGAMEATHLGAWMAGRTDAEVDDAVKILCQAPTFQDQGWMDRAFQVRERFPVISDFRSLAIPTWFYGHEPPCVFATDIAKLFENSVREDTLLTEAYGGLIYFEGSAGTLQEIFQEAVQDHYVSLGYSSPMVFVDTAFWSEQIPIQQFMNHMMKNGRYRNLIISFVDTTDQIVESITSFRPEIETS